MTKKAAQQEALQRAKEKLENVDLNARCTILELPIPDKGEIHFRALGTDFILYQKEFQLTIANSGEPAKLSDHVLILHYLLHNSPISPAEKFITFRQLPGGQFYWQPFLSRTVKPLVSGIGNDLDLLKKNLDRFDWEPVELGDFSAKIHGIGSLYITLSYHKGDDEFPPDADVLFDECIKHVFSTEDAAVLASRICLGLL